MLKFFKVLFQKIFKKKNKLKGLGEYLVKKGERGELPKGTTVQDVGGGVFKIEANEELSFEEITSIIENFIKENK